MLCLFICISHMCLFIVYFLLFVSLSCCEGFGPWGGWWTATTSRCPTTRFVYIAPIDMIMDINKTLWLKNSLHGWKSTLMVKMLSTWMSDWLYSPASETKGLNQFDILNKHLYLSGAWYKPTFKYIWTSHLSKNNKGWALVGTNTSNNNNTNTTSNFCIPCFPPTTWAVLEIQYVIHRRKPLRKEEWPPRNPKGAHVHPSLSCVVWPTNKGVWLIKAYEFWVWHGGMFRLWWRRWHRLHG